MCIPAYYAYSAYTEGVGHTLAKSTALRETPEDQSYAHTHQLPVKKNVVLRMLIYKTERKR